MIKAIIFDCFGVIVGKGFESTYTHAGGDPENDKAFIEDKLGQANLGLISEDEFNSSMAEHLNMPLLKWHEALKEAELPDLRLLEYIKELKRHYKTAVLSNSNRGVLADKIGQDWLTNCFDEVVSSAEVGLVKPGLEIYTLTSERLGVEPGDCVFIDDHKSFVSAASTLGMQVILYRSFKQLKSDLDSLLSADNPKD